MGHREDSYHRINSNSEPHHDTAEIGHHQSMSVPPTKMTNHESSSSGSEQPRASALPSWAENLLNNSQSPLWRVVNDITRDNTNGSQVGIDTIRCHVKQFTVDPNTPLEITQHAYNSTGETDDKPLAKRTDGTVITGSEATLNRDRFQATVLGVHALFIQCSMPALTWGDNTEPVTTPYQYEAALTKLQSLLESEGIRCSLEDCLLSRIDVCRNVQTESPITAYEQALKRQNIPYLVSRDHGHTGVKWVSTRNGQGASNRELSFYSKTDEANLDTPRVQRLEYRLQRKRAVENELGEITAGALCETLAPVQEVFQDVVSELLSTADSLPEPDGVDNTNGRDNQENADTTAGVDDPGQTEGANEQVEVSTGMLTSAQIEDIIAYQREEYGQNCHSLNRTAWVIIVLACSDPDQLEKAFQIAASSNAGPGRGQYQVRDKFEEARECARMFEDGLKTEAERMSELQAKLLD